MKKTVLGKNLMQLLKENTRDKIRGLDFPLVKEQLKQKSTIKSK